MTVTGLIPNLYVVPSVGSIMTLIIPEQLLLNGFELFIVLRFIYKNRF